MYSITTAVKQDFIYINSNEYTFSTYKMGQPADTQWWLFSSDGREAPSISYEVRERRSDSEKGSKREPANERLFALAHQSWEQHKGHSLPKLFIVPMILSRHTHLWTVVKSWCYDFTTHTLTLYRTDVLFKRYRPYPLNLPSNVLNQIHYHTTTGENVLWCLYDLLCKYLLQERTVTFNMRCLTRAKICSTSAPRQRSALEFISIEYFPCLDLLSSWADKCLSRTDMRALRISSSISISPIPLYKKEETNDKSTTGMYRQALTLPQCSWNRSTRSMNGRGKESSSSSAQSRSILWLAKCWVPTNDSWTITNRV